MLEDLFRTSKFGRLQKTEDQMNRRLIIAGAATVAGVFAMPAVAQEESARSLPERFAATLSSHDIAAFAALFAEDYINHQMSAASPAPPPGKSPKQATIDFFAARLAGIPNLQVAVEATVVSNDRVAASFVYTGTHGGTYFGIRGGPGCLNRISASISGASAGVRLPSGEAAA
jgi:ketosteroid isomerase-like protein